MKVFLFLWSLAVSSAISPCGLVDLRPFSRPPGIAVVLNLTDDQLREECHNLFAIRQLGMLCDRLQPLAQATRRAAVDAGLLHEYICPEPYVTLRERLQVCVGTSDKRLPSTASPRAVRAHVLFCYHHFQCNLVAFQKDCEDGRFWLVRRLGEVCLASPSQKGGALYKQALERCEATFGKAVNDTVAEVLDQIADFAVSGVANVPNEAVFRRHVAALSAFQKAQATTL
eukprot:EG_transcript_27198